MYGGRVQDGHFIYCVLLMFEQHNDPYHTSLLILSAGLWGSPTVLHLVISLCITPSAPCHCSLMAKSAPLQLGFELLHGICFLQWAKVKSLGKFLFFWCWWICWKSNCSSRHLCLFWFGQVGLSVFRGKKKKKKVFHIFTRLRFLPVIYY